MRGSSVWTRLAGAVLASWAVFHVWRAFTLAITTDEAFTFLGFVSQDWRMMLRRYDANHHILHTILCKVSVGLFGASAWSLRLPALAGGLAYLALSWRLARRLSGTGPAMLACCLWMAALPHIADYLSLARGYSLALAFWAAAMLLACDIVLENQAAGDRKLAWISALLGLAVASNLVFVVPAAALGFTAALRVRPISRWTALAAPALAVFFVLLSVPLTRASADNYYFGAKHWSEMLDSLMSMSAPGWRARNGLALAGLVIVLLGRASRESASARWIAAQLGLCVLAVGVLHYARGMPLPYARTGIYLLGLIGLGAGVATAGLRYERYAAPVLIAAGLWFTFHFPLRASVSWPFDAGNRRIVDAVAAGGGSAPILCGEFPLQWGLEFERQTRRLNWPRPLTYEPGGQPASQPRPACEFLAIRTDEGPAALPADFTLVLRDAPSGVVLGRRIAPPGR